MKKYFWLLLVVVGCGDPEIEYNCQQVTIVVVNFSKESGIHDWTTVVEFPDGTRRHRQNKWGEVGDNFCAQKYDGSRWK